MIDCRDVVMEHLKFSIQFFLRQPLLDSYLEDFLYSIKQKERFISKTLLSFRLFGGVENRLVGVVHQKVLALVKPFHITGLGIERQQWNEMD